ncbi:MAG TPA: PepSY-associated TM helix domain-containing protein [Acidobacteriota bacterium]|nr:PepSY-associated TM helix domain-containing protein [Acidobacteriota bacterium]
MSFRKIIFWLHLVLGIVAGIIIMIMSITGVALTYEKQMTAWADKNTYRVHTAAGAVALPPAALVEKFNEAMPGVSPLNMTFSSDPAMPVIITIPPNQMAFLDPYTGELLGTGMHGVRAFFRLMTDWHRWLALTGENRQWGRAVTGACNLMFLFLAVSGLYLWWPKKWSAPFLRAIIWFRGGLKGKLRNYNWHHVFGFWPLIPLVLVIVSAVVISYPWANQLMFRLAGSEMSVAGGIPKRVVKFDPEAEKIPLDMTGIDKLFEKMQAGTAGWETISFTPPTIESKTISFTVNTGSGGQPQYRATHVVDRVTNEVLRTERFGDLDPGMQARLWMRFVHTGEYYGIIGQTIAGIASVAGVFLVWTGYALTIRRYRDWMDSRR